MKSFKFLVPILCFSLFWVSSVPIMGMAEVLEDTTKQLTDKMIQEAGGEAAIDATERAVIEAAAKDAVSKLSDNLATIASSANIDLESKEAEALAQQTAKSFIENASKVSADELVDQAATLSRSAVEDGIGSKEFNTELKNSILNEEFPDSTFEDLGPDEQAEVNKHVSSMIEELQTAADALGEETGEKTTQDIIEDLGEATTSADKATILISDMKLALGDNFKNLSEKAQSKLESAVNDKLTSLAKQGASAEELKAAADSITKSLNDSFEKLDGDALKKVQSGDWLPGRTGIKDFVDDGIKDGLDPANLKESLQNVYKDLGKTVSEDLLKKDVSKLSDKIISSDKYAVTRAFDTFSKSMDKNIVGRSIKGLASLGLRVSETLAMAVLFMVPNIIQSQVEADNARKAAYATISEPVPYGDWVLQILPSCLNADMPQNSIPIYAMIPAANIADPVPSTKISSTDSMTAASSSTVSLAQEYHIFGGGNNSPYTMISPTFLNTAQLAVSFPAHSYDAIASAAITDSNFSGLLIDLNQGYVVNATGELAKRVPLIESAGSSSGSQNTPTAVSTYLGEILTKLTLSGYQRSVQSTVIEALTFRSHEVAGKAVPARLFDLFDADPKTGALVTTSEKAVRSTSSFKPHTLIANALAGYTFGFSFGSVGHIAPLFGWGSNPPQAPDGVSLTGTFAEPENYAAQGCQVYTCTGTTFAKSLKVVRGKDGSAIDQGAQGFDVDYVVFLDENYKQVPLMASTPVEIAAGSGIYWPTISINPDVKYMTSILTVGSSVYPVLYGIDGSRYYGAKVTRKGIKALSSTVESQVLSVISGALSELQKSFPGLYAQYTVHKEALLKVFRSGPFGYGNIQLTSSEQFKEQIGKTSYLYLYEGIDVGQPKGVNFRTSNECTCYGTSNVADLLIAYQGNPNTDSDSTTATLPNPQANYFISLVTDIIYKKQPDGSLMPYDFSDAPVKKAPKTSSTYIVDNTALSNYEWLGAIASAITDIKPLENYVVAQRNAWAKQMNATELSQGITIDDLSFSLASGLGSDAEKQGCYILQVSPSPSIAYTNKDWFVPVNTQKPSIAGFSISGLQSAKALVSLVTGMVFDLNGDLLHDNGKPRVIVSGLSSKETVAQLLWKKINNNFSSATLGSFVGSYTKAANSYQKIMDKAIFKGTFGSQHHNLALSIFTGDLVSKNYVYFSQSAPGAHGNYEVDDIFVTANPSAPTNAQYGAPLNSDTEYVVSLITGQIYSQTGPRALLNVNALQGFVSQEKSGWSEPIQNAYAKNLAQHKAILAAEEAELKAFEKEHAASEPGSKVTLKAAQVKSIISTLGSTLPTPYGLLKQDQATKQFVHISPADPKDASKFIYLFFDVPNKYGKDGKGISTGAIYDEDGNLLQVIQGLALDMMKHQFGLYGNAIHYLGVPAMQPSLIVNAADANLKAGSNGKSMIVSSSNSFPGPKISMPNNYYLYYSTVMDNYYVLDAKNKLWISVAGGHTYQMSGVAYPGYNKKYAYCQPVPIQHSVAVSKSGNDMILLDMSRESYMQGLMKDSSGEYVAFTNDEKGGWSDASGEKYTVPAATSAVSSDKEIDNYVVTNVSKGSSKTYALNSSYAWYNLVYLPISSLPGNPFEKESTQDASLLSSKARTSDIYSSAKAVKVNGVLTYMYLADEMYKLTDSKGEFESLSQSGKLIHVSESVDKNTHVSYVAIQDPETDKVYQYGYIYQGLDESQLESLQATIFKGSVTTCPSHMPVGPIVKDTVTLNNKKEIISQPSSWTYNLFTPNLPSKGGKVQRTVVSSQNVLSAPSASNADFIVFKETLGNVARCGDGRYIATLYPDSSSNHYGPKISYITERMFVDLQTGALFDVSGKAFGASLALKDWIDLLNELQVSVVLYDAKNKEIVSQEKAMSQKTDTLVTALAYRNVATTNIQSGKSEEETVSTLGQVSGQKLAEKQPVKQSDNSDDDNIWNN